MSPVTAPAKVSTPAEARAAASGRSLVLASGVFDLLHPGHVTYLEACASLGEVLVVGVNTDISVARVRGVPPRLPLQERMAALAALSVVNRVVPFDEDHPGALIRALCPSVYVKGSDYAGKDLPELPDLAAVGGRFVISPTRKTHSSRRLWAEKDAGR